MVETRKPLKMSKLPDVPWKNLNVDFYTLLSGEEILVVVSEFSLFSEAEIVARTAAKRVVPTEF